MATDDLIGVDVVDIRRAVAAGATVSPLSCVALKQVERKRNRSTDHSDPSARAETPLSACVTVDRVTAVSTLPPGATFDTVAAGPADSAVCRAGSASAARATDAPFASSTARTSVTVGNRSFTTAPAISPVGPVARKRRRGQAESSTGDVDRSTQSRATGGPGVRFTPAASVTAEPAFSSDQSVSAGSADKTSSALTSIAATACCSACAPVSSAGVRAQGVKALIALGISTGP